MWGTLAGVVDFVVALSRADQAEVDSNRVAVYLNLAAAYMALQARRCAAVALPSRRTGGVLDSLLCWSAASLPPRGN